jgi:hypothetical protein
LNLVAQVREVQRVEQRPVQLIIASGAQYTAKQHWWSSFSI